MEWIEISFDVDPLAEEALCAFLFDMGCSGIVQEDFGNNSVRAFVPFKKDFEDICQKIGLFLKELGSVFPEIPPPEVHYNKIEETDWATGWKRFFKSERVTPGLLIVPAWEPMPDLPPCRVLRIDPGPAFGTGQHPTTRMCLKVMEKILPGEANDMLDVGTGSGILAIYAALLGVEQITGIDIDNEALRWADRNIALNELQGKIALSAIPIERLSGTFSVLTANLILEEILRIMKHLARLTRPMGWLIISGILRGQIPEVKASLDRSGYSKRGIMNMEEWSCIYAQKKEGAET